MSFRDLKPGDIIGVTAEGMAVVVGNTIADARARDLAQAEADVAQALADRASARGYDAVVAAERAFMVAATRRIALRS